jgi:hypothetical protein
MPISLTKDDFSFNFNRFSKVINFKFPDKYSIVQGIVNKQRKTSNFVLGEIINSAYINKFEFEVSDITTIPGAKMITLVFNETEFDEFEYSFVMKYDN